MQLKSKRNNKFCKMINNKFNKENNKIEDQSNILENEIKNINKVNSNFEQMVKNC